VPKQLSIGALSPKRYVAAANAFFRRAIKSQGRLPHKTALGGYQTSHQAAREFLKEIPEH
jgi:transposase-like protein